MACYLIINCWSHSDLIELKEPPAGRIIVFELREGGVDTTVAAGRACGPVAVLTEASKEVSGREEVINEDVIFGFWQLINKGNNYALCRVEACGKSPSSLRSKPRDEANWTVSLLRLVPKPPQEEAFLRRGPDLEAYGDRLIWDSCCLV